MTITNIMIDYLVKLSIFLAGHQTEAKKKCPTLTIDNAPQHPVPQPPKVKWDQMMLSSTQHLILNLPSASILKFISHCCPYRGMKNAYINVNIHLSISTNIKNNISNTIYDISTYVLYISNNSFVRTQ